MYLNGEGLPQDFRQAADFFRRAAEQGDAPAQFSLGLMYGRGQGVPQDFDQAQAWIQKAADQGLLQAREFLQGAEKIKARSKPQIPKETQPDDWRPQVR
ncbi:MAG: putative beta-lactamase HcpC precursor [Deltaproteobacteria bacterium ADurb.Bin510]|nr:MAG: putative beta-lactamase HcpC precursor [Deltaproteobacteria bacterium ADurb.Bin510]